MEGVSIFYRGLSSQELIPLTILRPSQIVGHRKQATIKIFGLYARNDLCMHKIDDVLQSKNTSQLVCDAVRPNCLKRHQVLKFTG